MVSLLDYDGQKNKGTETGFCLAARFSKPHPNLIFAAGAGKNEMKIFENNCDGSQTFKLQSTGSDVGCPILALDVCNRDNRFAVGCQNGNIYISQYDLNEE
jgi:hypothetical protein